MADSDLIRLYSKRILALAANIPNVGRLDAPMGSATMRAPLCGSKVTVDLDLDAAGRISRFGQDVKACALGQAAAAVVGAAAPGRDREELEAAREALAGMLQAGGPAPTAPFDGLEVLAAAREFPNRHASILLSLDAALAAIDATEQRAEVRST